MFKSGHCTHIGHGLPQCLHLGHGLQMLVKLLHLHSGTVVIHFPKRSHYTAHAVEQKCIGRFDVPSFFVVAKGDGRFAGAQGKWIAAVNTR